MKAHGAILFARGDHGRAVALFEHAELRGDKGKSNRLWRYAASARDGAPAVGHIADYGARADMSPGQALRTALGNRPSSASTRSDREATLEWLFFSGQSLLLDGNRDQARARFVEGRALGLHDHHAHIAILAELRQLDSLAADTASLEELGQDCERGSPGGEIRMAACTTLIARASGALKAKYLTIRGVLYKRRDAFARAEEDLSQSIAIKPSALAHATRGFVRRMMGQYQSSYDDYAEAARLDPGRQEDTTGRGLALIGLGRYEEAVAMFERGRRLPGGNKTDAAQGRGAARLARGDPAKDDVRQATHAFGLAKMEGDDSRTNILWRYITAYPSGYRSSEPLWKFGGHWEMTPGKNVRAVLGPKPEPRGNVTYYDDRLTEWHYFTAHSYAFDGDRLTMIRHLTEAVATKNYGNIAYLVALAELRREQGE